MRLFAVVFAGLVCNVFEEHCDTSGELFKEKSLALVLLSATTLELSIPNFQSAERSFFSAGASGLRQG